MKRTSLLLCLLALSFLSPLFAQQYDTTWASLNKRKIPGWFHEAKFGIFIHWGVYAVPSFAVVSPGGYSEWYWHNLMTPGAQTHRQVQAFHEKNFGRDFPYAKFEQQFTAALFDPAQWADIFRRSGARYVVLTSKHHEGYCLWNSPWADKAWGRPWNAVTGTPKRDLLGDLSDAVRKAGLRMGYYYSLYEWFNPLWLSNKQQYIKEVMEPEFKDLVTRYKPSVIFSDGEWELSDTAWHSPALLAWLYNQSPVKEEIVVNDRWGSNTRGHNSASTYLTSEYGSGMEPGVIWEESRGIGQSYGYNRMENVHDYKSSHDLLLALIDIVSRGGNLLLDIGPTADGRIPVIMQQRLVDIGDWLQVNGEAIYGTTAWEHTRQWSPGKQPEIKKAAFMADYDITRMVQPSKEHASIEMFFTRKNNNLYCIMPAYTPHLLLRNYTAPAGAKARILGSNAGIRLKQQGKDCVIDLSALHPGDISHKIFVIKITSS